MLNKTALLTETQAFLKSVNTWSSSPLCHISFSTIWRMQNLWSVLDRLRRIPHWRFTTISSTNFVKLYKIVMHMEIFVTCIYDLASLGRVRVGLDLSLFSPLVLFSFFFPRCFGEWKVLALAVPLRCGRIKFLRWGDGSKTHEGTLAAWTILGWSVSALLGFWGFLDFLVFFSWWRYTDCGLQATVYANFAPWTGYLPLV